MRQAGRYCQAPSRYEGNYQIADPLCGSGAPFRVRAAAATRARSSGQDDFRSGPAKGLTFAAAKQPLSVAIPAANRFSDRV
jgi:hypothetical protein